MSARVGIIGLGWVGSSVAISTLHRGLASELLLNDVREGLAQGEAMDFEHGSLFYRSDASVRAASVEEMAESCDAVVLAAGRGGGATESRLALAQDNAAMATDIGRRLRGFAGVVVVVSNPVDVLAQVVQEASALPRPRVIGTGTLLDSARLRYELGAELDVHPQSVHAYVVGEHGDSEVCLWSSARVGGRSVRDWPGWSTATERAIAERVRRAAYEIIARKGATNHAIGLVTATLLAAILGDEKRILTVSRVHDGACGLSDVAVSLPTVIRRSGAATVVEPGMDADELQRLERSAGVVRNARREISALDAT